MEKVDEWEVLGLTQWDRCWIQSWPVMDSDREGIRATNETSARPFDLQTCLDRFSPVRFIKRRYYSRYPELSGLDLPDNMSREEAHFWLEAACIFEESPNLKKIRKYLGQITYDGNLEFQQILQRLINTEVSAMIMVPLSVLLPPRQLLDLCLIPVQKHRPSLDYWHLSTGLKYALVRAGAAEIDELKAMLVDRIHPESWPEDHLGNTAAFWAAASLGMHDELITVVESWPDDYFGKESWRISFYQPQTVIFGLRDSQLIRHHMRRLKLNITEAEYIKAWLANFGSPSSGNGDFKMLEDAVLAQGNRDDALRFMHELVNIKHPDLAPHMLNLYLDSRASQVAGQWLNDNPPAAITGLANAAGGIYGKYAHSHEAMDFLLTLMQKGHGQQMQAIQARLHDASAAVLRSVAEKHRQAPKPFTPQDTPTWLEPLNADPPLPAVEWIGAGDLPAIACERRCLDHRQTDALLRLLKSQPDSEFLDALKTHADAGSLSRFAWRLFQAWMGEGAPAKEKWAMLAMGRLGDNDCALRLTPLIRQWPGESQHKRAVLGLDVLKTMGTATALMQLNGIAQKVKFRGIKTTAQTYMEAIAEQRGMSREQLEDLVVPDCGLDADGCRVFDYGPRQFHFVLGDDMKPKLRDEKGNLRDNPPKPAAKDDAEKAPAAEKAWKLMKKQIRDTAKIQAQRLEAAMITGRRWPPGEFDQIMIRHPLMCHIARLLLWGGYDANAKLQTAFRITEEKDFSDVNDDRVDIGACHEMAVLHPLALSSGERRRWGEVFSDYQLIPPFPQLGRDIHTLSPQETAGDRISRFNGMRLPAPSLVFGLEKHGWIRGAAEDAGGFNEHSKPFPGNGFTAVIRYEGVVGMGYIEADEILTVKETYVVAGIRHPQMYYQDKAIAPLSKVDPIVISEVIRELTTLQAKAI